MLSQKVLLLFLCIDVLIDCCYKTNLVSAVRCWKQHGMMAVDYQFSVFIMHTHTHAHTRTYIHTQTHWKIRSIIIIIYCKYTGSYLNYVLLNKIPLPLRYFPSVYSNEAKQSKAKWNWTMRYVIHINTKWK